jgi:photosystem II stability/assembly factor-like uncharacterized protein
MQYPSRVKKSSRPSSVSRSSFPLRAQCTLPQVFVKAFAAAIAAAILPVSHANAQAPHVPYQYRNVAIVAGGFITGFVPQPKIRGLYYVRTDIGGAYRWDANQQRWQPLQDWLPFSERNLLGAESLAVDPSNPHRLYIAAGTYINPQAPDGAILRSDDEGRHFVTVHVPFKMGGNEEGRFAGERLAVDPNHPQTLLMGTRLNGLWRSDDSGINWRRVYSFLWPLAGAAPLEPKPYNAYAAAAPPVPGGKDGLTFVTFDAASGVKGQPTPVIFVGADDANHSLWRSDDAGQSWKPVPGGPDRLFPNHGVLGDQDTLYLSYANQPGPNDMTNGAVWTYAPRTGTWHDITPEKPGTRGERFGYGTVTVGPAVNPDTSHGEGQVLLASTMDRWRQGDTIYRSTDGGAHWVSLKEGATRDASLAPWTRHTASQAPFGHWLGAAMVDPFDPAHVLYGTGETIWESHDVRGPSTHWLVGARGLEETADITLLSPLLPGDSGPHLYTGLGDIGCFRHDDLDRSPANGAMKNPELSNCDSIALAADHPRLMVRVGRSWSPGPHGALSSDGGQTWKPLLTEPQGGERGGEAALSADGTVIAWAVHTAQQETVLYESGDAGVHWQAFPIKAEGRGGLQILADTTQPKSFWAFDPGTGTLYSVDSATGTARVMTNSAPRGTQLRIAASQPGALWLAGASGLFRAAIPAAAAAQTLDFQPIATVSVAYAVGFGKSAPTTSFGPSAKPAPPAIYMAGKLSGTAGEDAATSGGGIYRSLDDGSTWQRIDDPEHRFAWIEQITGDPRLFGRVYMGTNGRGVLIGDPQ